MIFLRTSERTSFKRCRFAWEIAYNMRLKPKVSAPPLRFGSLVHKAMELRYPPGIKRGPHPAETFLKEYERELDEAKSKFGFKDEDGEWHDAGALGVDMLEHYVDQYGKEDEWKVIASELAFQVPIMHSKKRNETLVYVGIIDGVWQHRSTKEIVLRDWKTAKSIPAKMGTHLTLDEQPGSYWSYAPDFLRSEGILKPNQRLRGIDFFYMRKAMRDLRKRNKDGHYLNKDGSVSKQQPADYFKLVPTIRAEAEQMALRQRVLAEAREHRLVRAGKLESYKNPGQMNCQGCGYAGICELHESGQDWESMLKATLVPWDPYAEHEIRGSELR
jgi:hypothetical protein